MNKLISIMNIFIDYLLLVVAVYGSLWLRFNGHIPEYYLNVFFKSIWFIAAGKIIIFYLFRIYKIIVKFVHTYDILNIISV